ncbi:MAG: mandelate racemase/muconate lactonizing enzyme family protein [Thermomicrobiales bacterium]|nr:mandelate racemase/muconate lactonizing enzyme family protein [Thermomicrobiales bacterium]
MRIRDVEFLALRSPLPQPARFSWGSAASRNVGLVRVETEDSLVGWGETSVTFPLWSLEERALTVREGLRPLVLGEDASDIDGLLALLNRTLGRLGPLWSPVGVQAAIGAFEVALWDIAARAAGIPLWQALTGGAAGTDALIEGVPLYAVGFGGTPDQIAEGAVAALNTGYPWVKVRVGFGREQDGALLNAVAAAVPDMRRVLVDANMAWSRDDARELAPWVGSYGVGWLEEPVVWNDYAGLHEIRGLAGVPLAAGENAYGRTEALRLVAEDAADIVMPDIARCGGITNARLMIAAARAKGRSYSPHHYASEIGFITSLHLCAAEPGFHSLLRDVSAWPLRHEILTEPPRVEGGRGWLPSGPGLGVEIDSAALDRYRIA